ncbi:MAG: hypothetical protein J3Q66DRAFT_437087 [Benniella sp.]|nr:MAG: hypothetical protein J3Q66DRAFT_437087 [Benniella sp.]
MAHGRSPFLPIGTASTYVAEMITAFLTWDAWTQLLRRLISEPNESDSGLRFDHFRATKRTTSTTSKAQETAKTMDILEPVILETWLKNLETKFESLRDMRLRSHLTGTRHLVQEFVEAGVPETSAQRIELLQNVNQYRQAKGLDRRSMSFLLAKLALVDKASNGAQLLPDSLNTEAFQTVEDSSHSADYELRQVAQKRKLEQDQLEISIKKIKYLEAREADLLRRKAEDERLLQKLLDLLQLEEALCESQRSHLDVVNLQYIAFKKLALMAPSACLSVHLSHSADSGAASIRYGSLACCMGLMVREI